MQYANIPVKILKLLIGEDYETGNYTLQDELNKLTENIVWAEWTLEGKDHLTSFHAWTKSYVVVLITGIFGDKYIKYVDRNPPELNITQKRIKK